MDVLRSKFQGIWNIIRFNWHFFLIAGSIIVIMALFHWYLAVIIGLIPIMASLLISMYIYDFSGLYELSWIEHGDPKTVVNVHAGFDETSVQLYRKFPAASIFVFDFYNPVKHTEVSVKRARRAYPPFPGTRQIDTGVIPLEAEVVDQVFVTFSAHEIRNDLERVVFFKELKRVMHVSSIIQVTEHLRDVPNFLVYNVGAFHFLSRKSWLQTFTEAGLRVRREKKVNPFITTFILEKHDLMS